MKSIIFKFIAGETLKLGIGYALQIINNAIAALQGVLSTGSISDDARSSITRLVTILTAVYEFMERLAELFGAPLLPLKDARSMTVMEDAAAKLRKLTDAL